MVTAAPSAWAASIVHDFTDSPSTSTVHAPQLDVSHPTLVPVSPQSSRRYCTSRVRGSTSWACAPPFTVIEICMGPDLGRPAARTVARTARLRGPARIFASAFGFLKMAFTVPSYR